VTEAGFGADLGAREIPRHQVPQGRAQARLRRDRRHHPRAQDARRRQERGPEEGRPQGAGSRHGEPERHIENIKKFGLPAVVSINRFSADTDAEIALVKEKCKALGVEA
jgi:formate--tetrahydrofolate ligase